MKKAIIAILLAQLAVIGAMIWRYEEVVRKGIEFRVPCRAYDPRNPWRGRYLRSTVTAGVTVVTNHVIAAPDPGRRERLGPGYVMVDKHSVTGAPPLLVYKDEEPTLNPPFWFRAKKTYSAKDAGWLIDLPNTLYIPERIADNADKILSQSVSPGDTNRAIAVFRAWKGDVVITDIEIDGVPIGELSNHP